jgi:hypothetical protein
MGCSAFLGEEIEQLKGGISVDQDHLTIEVENAKKSDLIVMFLGSIGTVAELVAFVTSKEIRRKILVFNDAKYQNTESFLTLGPLRLLPKGQLHYYSPNSSNMYATIISLLDQFVAHWWFGVEKKYSTFSQDFEFIQFITLLTIYSSFPVRYSDVERLLPASEKQINSALKHLLHNGIILKEEKKYIPANRLEETPLDRGMIASVAAVRTEMLSARLRNPDVVTDYRVIF